MDRLIRLLALAGLLAFSTAVQAQTQVCGTLSTCPNASTPLAGTELMYLVQSGVSKKITVSSLLEGFFNFPLAVSLGGTGNTTGPAALGPNGLNAFSQTPAGANNFSIPVAARTVLVGSIASAVVYTLPAAATYPAGSPLIIADYLGNVTSTNTVTVDSQGSDTINGGPGLTTMQSAFSSMMLESDGVSHWFTVGGGGAGGGGSSIPPEDWCSPAASGCGSNSFTPGTTTSLTLSVTPPGGANQLNIYYDGVHLNSTMWSLSGNVVNFLTPITAQYVVEITYSGGGGGGSGTVTSVGLALPTSVFSISGSPITLGGTLTGSFINQNANTALMGPTTGSAAVPVFRQPLGSDIGFTQNGTSPVTTTLGARAQEEWLYVEDFGVDCSGVTDSTTTLSNAVASAIALNRPLRVCAGTIKVSPATPIQITGSFTMEGAGKLASIFSNTSNTYLFQIATTAAISWKGVGYAQTSASPSAGGFLTNVTTPSGGENGGSLFFDIGCNNVWNCLDLERASGWKLIASRIANYFNTGITVQNLNAQDSGDSEIDDTDFLQFLGNTCATTGIGILQEGSGGLKVHGGKGNCGATYYELALNGSISSSISIFSGVSVENCAVDCFAFVTSGSANAQWGLVSITGSEISPKDGANGVALLGGGGAGPGWLGRVSITGDTGTVAISGGSTGGSFIFAQSGEDIIVTGNAVGNAGSGTSHSFFNGLSTYSGCTVPSTANITRGFSSQAILNNCSAGSP